MSRKLTVTVYTVEEPHLTQTFELIADGNTLGHVLAAVMKSDAVKEEFDTHNLGKRRYIQVWSATGVRYENEQKAVNTDGLCIKLMKNNVATAVPSLQQPEQGEQGILLSIAEIVEKYITPVTQKLDEQGQKLDEQGQKLDVSDQKLDEQGRKLDATDQKLDQLDRAVRVEQRTLTTKTRGELAVEVRKRLIDASKEIVFAGDEEQPPFISVEELKELDKLMTVARQQDAVNEEEGIEREENHGSISSRNEPTVKRKQPAANVMLEKLVTCYITPLLSRAVGGSTQVVNSETLPWLQKKAGDPANKWLKPDLWGSPVPRVITRKEAWHPPSNANAITKKWMIKTRTDHKMIQGRMHMKVLDLIAFLVEIKLSFGDRTNDSFKECEGQIMEYLMVVSGSTGGVCSGMLFALDGVILYEATNGRIEKITSFAPCTPGGRAKVHRCLNMHKSPWVIAIAGCEAALGVKVTGFVGAGGNGRVFSVENKSSEKFAMKIVLGSAADKLPAERASLDELKSSGVVPAISSEAFTAPQTTDEDGAVIPRYTAFLMDLGEPITRFDNSDIKTAFKHLHVIHEAGKTHGDPRFPDNLIRKEQSLLWVDFFPVPPGKQPSFVNDVVILVLSICPGALEPHTDVGNLLKAYDNHRSLENLLKVSEHVTAARKQS